MPHVIEPAASGRSKCRACSTAIAKGELRFGERLPNPFADGEMTVWFHLQCAAYTRPDSLQETTDDLPADQSTDLLATIKNALAHERLQQIGGIGLSPSARARCRQCREPIARDDWRIPLKFFDEGVFNSGGYIHLSCAADYVGTRDIAEVIFHFQPDLTEDSRAQITDILAV
jgi:hypothetical protein